MNGKQQIRVMLADDDEDDRLLFREAVESLSLSIQLVTVDHGKELIEYLENPDNPAPDMIFMDLNMPYLSGLECLPMIRKIRNFQNVPIAIYSTSSAKHDVEESLVRGANIYIKKPNEFAKLQEIIRKAVHINWQYIHSDFDSETFVMSL